MVCIRVPKDTKFKNKAQEQVNCYCSEALDCPTRNNKHSTCAHAVYMIDIYNKDTGVQYLSALYRNCRDFGSWITHLRSVY